MDMVNVVAHVTPSEFGRVRASDEVPEKIEEMSLVAAMRMHLKILTDF